MSRATRFVAALLGGVVCISSAAHAQCTASFVAMPGVTAQAGGTGVDAITLWDPDGPGPLGKVLVAGGTFDLAGMTLASNIAVWDGAAWSRLGSGITGGGVNALAALPDGKLVAAGTFTTAGGLPASNIAVWNGAAWAELGGGVNNTVWALAVAPNGDLYVGGMFTSAGGVGGVGGVTCNRIARWNGTAWSALGSGTGNGVGNVVYTIAALPNDEVIVGGGFTTAGGALARYIARWNGTSWAAIGGGMNSTVLAVAAASSSDIVASGTFTFPTARIARFTGAGWTAMGAGLNAQALTLAYQEDGSIIAGGHFVAAGSIAASKVARWDGASWTTYGSGMDAYIIAQATMPSGDIYFGGGFTTAGGIAANCIARWTAPSGPSFTQQPLSVRTCSSGSATFTAVATGTAPPALRWQAQLTPPAGVWTDIPDGPFVYNGVMLFTAAGAATGTLTLTGLTTFDLFGPSLELRCAATDACGTVPSAAATLRVCPADFDCSGALGVQDIFDCLAAWFAGSPTADFNHTGGITVQDIFDFLAAWFVGC